ncbi:MAG: polysaccharide biosynthesis/export family protein, partial [Verrucomicrobia bacterium]|nr:polysaccharide biosynthesis/export family protein [Verrucomicrobiota bacterium]
MIPRTRVAILLSTLLIVTGCSRQDFSGLRVPRPFAGTDPTTVGAEGKRNQQIQSALATSQALQSGESDLEYELGPGDRLSIAIFALESPGETTTLDRRVQNDFTVTLPWVGKVSSFGATVSDFEDRVRSLYAGRYLKDPQISVRIAEHQSVAIVMTGAVGKPGVYHLQKNRSTVLEMLATAGGLRNDAGDVLYIMRTPERDATESKPALIPVNLNPL